MCMKLQETAHVLPPFAHSAAETATQSKRHGIKWNNMVPLLYAPALPLVRIVLRNHPVIRDRVFLGGILTALAHAGWVMSSDSSVL